MQGLAARYGNPMHALNLVKAAEKRPRESILRSEFSAAVSYLNSTVRSLVLAPASAHERDALLYCECAPERNEQ